MPREWWSRYDDRGRPVPAGFVFAGCFDDEGNATGGARVSLGYDIRGHRHFTMDDSPLIIGGTCLDEAAESAQEAAGEPVPVRLAEFIARSFIKLEVTSAAVREALWRSFTSALDTSVGTSPARMPWEAPERVTEISSAGMLAALQAMLNTAYDVAGEDECERMAAALRQIGEVAEEDWKSGRLTWTSSGEAVLDKLRRCEVCGVSIQKRHPNAKYCAKHRNTRQKAYAARRKAKRTSGALHGIRGQHG